MDTQPRWTLDELVDQVALALSSSYGGQASGRVRDLPDRRAVRYYTTLGLIDRPAGWRGRVALYSHLHLLQLTAIKRLQASGHSLAEIQVELTGCGEERLRELAGGGPPAGGTATPRHDRPAVAPPRPSPARSRFWSARAAEPAPPGAAPTGDERHHEAPDGDGDAGQAAGRTAAFPDWADDPDDALETEEAELDDGLAAPAVPAAPEGPPAARHDGPAQVLHGIRLAPDLILIDLPRVPRALELDELRAAAGPLLATLDRLGLRRRAGDLPPTTERAHPPEGRARTTSTAPPPAPTPTEGDAE